MKIQFKFILLSILISSCSQNKKELVQESANDYVRISENSTYGFVNNKGDTIIPLGKYSFLNPIDEEGMILAEFNNRHGYIDINQNVIIPFKYDDLSVFTFGLTPAKKKGKYGYINREGEVVIDFEYDNESHFNKCGLARAKRKNKFGFIDTLGKIVLLELVTKMDTKIIENYARIRATNFLFGKSYW